MAKNGIMAAARSWFGKSEKRDISISDPALANILGPAQYANNEAALKLATASRCISLISGAFASTDVTLYRQKADSTPEAAVGLPLHDIMLNGTADMSAFELKFKMMESLTSYGETFAKVDFDSQGRLTNIAPLDWHNVTVEVLGNGRTQFRVRDPLRNYSETVYSQDSIFHGKWRPGADGRGRSPITLAALTLGISVGTEQAVSDSASSGFRAAGVLSAPGAISDATATRLKEHWQANYTGGNGAGKVAIVGDGLKFEQISVSNSDQEVLETRRFDAYMVASAYGVQPDVAGLPFHSTWSSAAEANRQFVTLGVEPWSQCICQQICAFVLGTTARKTLYLAANWSNLISGSLQERATAYSSLITSRIYTINEARAVFDLPRIDGGDELVNTAAAPTVSEPVVAAAGES
jgi:HK97 family phage portal protein